MKSYLLKIVLCIGFTALLSVPGQAQPAMLGLRAAEQRPETPTTPSSPARISSAETASHPMAKGGNVQPPATLVLPAGTIVTSGAAAGTTAAIAGVLLTRGEETEISPEKLLTFRLAAQLTVSTEQSQHAFWQVTSDDYVIPGKTAALTQGIPGPMVVSKPSPRHIPLSVWPETEGLAAGRPGHKARGD